MSQNIIATQVRFLRSATNFEFKVMFQDFEVAEVKRVNVSVDKVWQIVDTEIFGKTREEASTTFIVSQNLFV